MMVIELFAPKGVLDADLRRAVTERLGSLDGLVPEEERHAGIGAVFGSMFHVMVHEPEAWVTTGEVVEAGRPVFLVRIWVPGPWRKDMSEHMIGHVTKALTDLTADPTVLVHVLGVPEGGIGVDGHARTSTELVELMGQPYEEDLAQGRAVRDPLCGVIVPLNDRTATLELDGVRYGFCCSGCREEFVKKRQRTAPS